tara:strand:- start:208 stop:432 length:225 start_codon:yes stop_codon:yes gene_type:complete
MTTRTQKIGINRQMIHNKSKSLRAISIKQNRNVRRKQFNETKAGDYWSKSNFITTWKPYFPMSRILRKWEKINR